VEGRGGVDPATNKVRIAADAPFVGIDQPGDVGEGKVWFRETRHSVSGKILEYWNRYGGLQQFGFPLSEAFNEISATDGKTYQVQYFERARFEVHPEKQAPYEVELGLLGVQQYKSTPVAADQLPVAPPAGVTSAKDTYIAGSLQEPDTLFCNEANTVVAQRFCAAITYQDALVGGDDKEVKFPLAAWYVPTLENGGSFFVGVAGDRHLVTKYKLRRGIKWSDGKELTSNDAVFSYQFILNDPNSVYTSLWKKISYVDNPDKYTVVYNFMSVNEAKAKYNDPQTDKNEYAFLELFIDLNRPVIDLSYYFVGTVHAKHVLERIPIDKVQESSEGQKPTGYGPYIVQDWKQGDTLTLVANPNYNLTAAPPIKRVINRFNTDVNANVNAFLTGNLDAIESEGFVVPPEQSDQIKAAGGIVSAVPAAAWEHLEPWFEYGPFKDINVRKAMIHAINRQQVVDVAFKGAGQIMNGPNPPSVWHSLEHSNFATEFPDLAQKYKLPIYEYNPATARQLLDQAGWVPGPDGIRAKGGEKLSFEYGTTRNATRQAIQALISNDLKQVGIDAQQVNYPRGFFDDDGPRATGKTKLAQFAYVGTSASNYDPYDSAEWNTEANPTGTNTQHYKNEKVDAANRLYSATIDRKEQAEQSAIVQVEMMTDVAVIPLVARANIEIYSAKLKNRKTTNSSFAQWWNIGSWYFER
jgi:ABC-type transport system substrate-binding protein